MKNIRRHLTLGLALACSACASTAPWQAPGTELPAQWTVPVSAPATAQAWWSRLGDPTLEALMAQALRANADLAVAAIRVRSAQGQAGLVAAGQAPGLALSSGAATSRPLRGGVWTPAVDLGATLGYEVDLWGKLGAQRDAAQWRLQATQADCQATAVALTSSLATLVWQLARLNQLVALGDSDLAQALQTQALVEARFQAGAISGLARSQAAVLVTGQRSLQAQWRQQRLEARHALSLLLGQPPDAPLPELAPLSQAELPAVEAGLPAQVLGQRPDLQAAERRLREAFGNIELTRKSFYPSLTLTGTLGGASDSLLGVLRNPVAALGAGLVLPFLQASTRELSVRVSQAQYEAAVVGFRQSLYGALGDVEDALSAKQSLSEVQAQARVERQETARIEALTRVRYEAGQVELQVWLDAALALRNAERALVQGRFNQLANEARLYKALGQGGALGVADCRLVPAAAGAG